MKHIIQATYSLFFFKPYTDMKRSAEIKCGILAWVALGIVIFALIN